MTHRRSIPPIVLLWIACLSAVAQTPLGTAFSYQGRLDQLGQPLNGAVNLQFRCYDAATGGNLLGTQALPNVVVTDGSFAVALNEAGQLGANAFAGQRRWLEISVNGTLLSPREEFKAAPYALHSAGPWVTSGQHISYTRGNVGVGTSTPGDPLSVSAAGYGLVHTSGTTALGTFVDATAGWLGTRSTHPLHLFSSNGGPRVTVATTGLVGIGTTAPTSTLHVNGTAQMNGFLMPSGAGGGRVLTSDATGNGTWQAATGLTLPYSGTANAPGDALFRVTNTNPNFQFSAGVWGECASNTNGRGVVGFSPATTGVNYGVVGQSNSLKGVGVLGYTPNGDFFNPGAIGVYGLTDAQGGTGVVGRATTDASGVGVEGIGQSTGVSGCSPENFGVEGIGRVGVHGIGGQIALLGSGNLEVSGVKAFRIDHPADPANKYLFHYSTESPEVINFYRGTAILNDVGEATVELPRYFAQINTAPSYQLTAVGGAMPMLHVATEVDEAALAAGATLEPGQAAPTCSFRIAGGTARGKVSWRVEARRNDRWTRTSSPAVEVDKPNSESGTYQHPDLFGQPPEKGTYNRSRPEYPAPPTDISGSMPTPA